MNIIEEKIVTKQPFSDEDINDVITNPRPCTRIAQEILVHMIDNDQAEDIAYVIYGFLDTKAKIDFSFVANKLLYSNATNALRNIGIFTSLKVAINVEELIERVIKEGNGWMIARYIDNLVENGAEIGKDIDLDFISKEIESNHKQIAYIESLHFFTEAGLVNPTCLFDKLINIGKRSTLTLLIKKLDNFLQVSTSIDIDKFVSKIVENHLSENKTLINRTLSFVIKETDENVIELAQQLAKGSSFEQELLVIFLQKFNNSKVSPIFIAKLLIDADRRDLVFENFNKFSTSTLIRAKLFEIIAQKN